MGEISFAEQKNISLEILECVHRFCVDNNIKYSLAYGTLIGAIRHKGFIPWDDDIDIIMPRSDYERFVRTFNSNGKNAIYRVVDNSTDEAYPYSFAKVEDRRTIKNELGYDKLGLCIDVFPLDKFPDDVKEAKEHFVLCRRLMHLQDLKKMKWRKGRKLYKNLFLYVSKLFLMCYPLPKLISNINEKAQKYNNNKTKNIFCFVAEYYGEGEIVPATIFDNIIDLEFEGRYFKAVDVYDDLLTRLYGDYMQLPPEEKRVTHHDYTAYWR